jgi:hypothetical protein
MTISLKDGYTPEVESDKDADGNITARRVYLVTATPDEPQEGLELEVLNFPDLPDVGSIISPNYPNVVFSKKRAEPLISGEDGDFIEWKVEVDYVTDNTGGGGGAVDPTDEPPNIILILVLSNMKKLLTSHMAQVIQKIDQQKLFKTQ